MEGEDFIVGSVFREERGMRWVGGWTVGKMYGSYGVLLGSGDETREIWDGSGMIHVRYKVVL